MKHKEYDYLIVGAGLFGATFAYMARQSGKRCLVIDKRPNLGGNIHCENVGGITVHEYGPHIFHTNDKEVWKLVNRFVPFNQFTLNTVAVSNGKLYNLPFNMHTFYQMWGVAKPEDALAIIERQRREAGIHNPRNLEEQAISLVGHDVYETLIKGYTEKQWGRPCRELPAGIIKRLPVRLCFNNNYFNDRFQGIPAGGYNGLINRLLEGIDCRIDCNYMDSRSAFDDIAGKTIYTGSIDEFFGYKLGRLEYRSLRFERKDLPTANFQGNAIVNYANADVPYTRVVEHKWFDIHNADSVNAPHTVITREYPQDYTPGTEPYYPINDDRNVAMHEEYMSMARTETPDVLFAGRLGAYKYLDMDQVIGEVLTYWK